MRRFRFLLGLIFGVLALAAGAPALADKGGTPQASLTVTCGGVDICNATNTDWELTKTLKGRTDNSDGSASLEWTVTATKGTESDAFLKFTGSITVTNTGTGKATIGNIVVNLQTKSGAGKFATVSSDIADAQNGYAATQAYVCSGGSSEGLSVFHENAGSGLLSFTDDGGNTIFSLSPAWVLNPGDSKTLDYVAQFDATTLGLIAGAQVRLETIVTFLNAGSRGGSGAVCSGIDANGDGTLDSNVRSVPCRVSLTVPALEHSNSTAVLTDTSADSVTTTGTVSFGDFSTDIGGGSGTQTLGDSGTFSVKLLAAPGTDGGTITNCAFLQGKDADGITDPSCNTPVDLKACETETFGTPEHQPGTGCSYTQGGWGADPHGNNIAVLLGQKFATVYPGGVEVGIPGAGGFSMLFTSAAAINAYLPASGTPDVLDTDLINPTDSHSGVFGGQVLALQLNVDFGIYFSNGGIGGKRLIGTGTTLDGLTVSQIVALANQVLGAADITTLANGYELSVSDWNDLITNLNESFDNCQASDFAAAHLTD